MHECSVDAEVQQRWADPEEKRQWYAGAQKYWSEADPTNNGVLGGYERVHPADAEDSLRFMWKNKLCRRTGPTPGSRALDVAAGVGRVTDAVLLRVCDTVDLLEGAQPLLDAAKEKLAPHGDRVGEYICAPMQDFAPAAGRYNLIWLQWCVGCLADDDLVAFLGRCRAALAPGGLIVVKDNVQEEEESDTYLVDDDDNSVMRTREYFEKMLTERCGFEIVVQARARLKCSELHPVRTYALR